MKIYASRRNRQILAAMKIALAENREKGAAAMKEALAQVAESGRAAGAALADTRKPVVVPGRRIRPVGDPLVETVVRAIPGARLVDVVRSEVVAEPGPSWWPKERDRARKCAEQGLIYCGPFPARPPKHQPPKEYPIVYTMPRPRPAVG